jgi:hypothetical protein
MIVKSLIEFIFFCGIIIALVTGCQRVNTEPRPEKNIVEMAEVVCRDGYAYLYGSAVNEIFVTPYLRNSVQGRCIGNKVVFDKEAHDNV